MDGLIFSIIVTAVIVVCVSISNRIKWKIRKNAYNKVKESARNVEKYTSAAKTTKYFCPFCGKENDSKGQTCMSCGAPLGSADIHYNTESTLDKISDIFGGF